jgi:hypothetical protein
MTPLLWAVTLTMIAILGGIALTLRLPQPPRASAPGAGHDPIPPRSGLALRRVRAYRAGQPLRVVRRGVVGLGRSVWWWAWAVPVDVRAGEVGAAAAGGVAAAGLGWWSAWWRLVGARMVVLGAGFVLVMGSIGLLGEVLVRVW